MFRSENTIFLKKREALAFRFYFIEFLEAILSIQDLRKANVKIQTPEIYHIFLSKELVN